MDILLTTSQIEEKVFNLAQDLQKVFMHQTPHVLVVLKGGFIFAADLIRFCPTLRHSPVDFVKLSSYQDNRKQGRPVINYLSTRTFSEPVLVVDDVYDTGETAEVLTQALKDLGVSRIYWAFAFAKKKPPAHLNPFVAAFVPRQLYLVGYGLDDDETSRGLPFLVALPPAP